ncbi:heavy-metal-associated domain-containing protein [Cryobacterium melibiosiphilum]|uniref:Heavy-metal-associated domain-containing protein n=1 Tax=Cryobacterium melibiosiphilum TaxID=995039 RepID=A0A3A5MA96_9MICO|nr:heavy metal-associated domain-containing protein [Cryobacterium melibiosiphilum]RJT84763.1 heavy-metal-associated domain-containing protein [Cryobacterium melibiosiphilum]
MCNTNAKDLGLTDATCGCGSHAHAPANPVAADAAPVTSTFEVSGMTCGHCVSSVTDEVSRLEGVSNVNVQLVVGGASRVTVSSTDSLDHDAVAAAIHEAGYELVSTFR